MHLRTARWAYALAGLAALLSATGPAAATATAAPTSSLPAGCARAATQTGMESIATDGHRTSFAAGDRLGHVYHYDVHGMATSEIVPPTGFRPLSASDADLKLYGFPPRPTEPAALAHWQRNMAAWKGSGTLNALCESNQSGSLTVTAKSRNWAGGMTVNGSQTADTFYAADGEFVQQGFVSSCSGLQSYTTWTGLGGYNQKQLIQAGTILQTPSPTAPIRMFYETISPTDPRPAAIWTDLTVSPGDQVEAYNYFDTFDNHAFTFVYDITTGLSHNQTIPNALNYYDGSTADFITEAPIFKDPTTGAAIQSNLTKTSGAGTYYYYATANSQPIANFSSWRIHQYNGTKQLQASGFDGVHAWTDTWKACS